MSKSRETILLLVIDLIAYNFAFILAAVGLRVALDLGGTWFGSFPVKLNGALAATVSLYWLVFCALFGLYKSWYNHSWVDEVFQVFKTSFFGMIVLSLVVFNLRGAFLISSVLLITYWLLLFGFLCTGRLGIRSFQRHLLIKGIGRRNTLIVGGSATGRDLLKKIKTHPALGYEAIGFVEKRPDSAQNGLDGIPFLGTYERIPRLVQTLKLSDIIIAVESGSHQEILDIIDSCNGLPVNLKIVPDLYDIASGHVKTQEISGFPLIDLLAEPMPAAERCVKRTIDIVVSLTVLLFFWPLWVLITMLIRLDTKGPIFFTQERVGKDGKVFVMIKFRSMVRDAEKRTGPVWAEKNDFRITRVGRIIRKFRLDEIPQFINILKGEMSLVGPRPERSYFVEQLKRQIPLYSKRLKVRPGLTGWAQTKHKYDSSLDDVREKVKYDLYYMRNMSLMLDVKILLQTVAVLTKGKGAH